MYFGNKYTNMIEIVRFIPRECNKCMRGWTAIVHAKGTGVGNSPYFLDNEGAKHRALKEAVRVAEIEAKDLASVVKCSSCRERDWAAVGKVGARSLVAGGGNIVVTFGGAAMFLGTGAMWGDHGFWIAAAIYILIIFFVVILNGL